MLALPPRVLQTPISCDTLLLTISPHHSVIHIHANSLLDVPALIRPYQQTHKVVLLSSSPEQARETLDAIENSRICSQNVQTDPCSPQIEKEGPVSKCP